MSVQSVRCWGSETENGECQFKLAGQNGKSALDPAYHSEVPRWDNPLTIQTCLTGPISRRATKPAAMIKYQGTSSWPGSGRQSPARATSFCCP